MWLYDLARKVNSKRKEYLKKKAGEALSPVRRIEFVYPPTCGRFVAMTFDDGPCALPPSDGGYTRGLTDVLLDTLAKYGAKGTFDVIGTTADNYPDTVGEIGKFTWSGMSYDHYPRFGSDELAGAFNRPELIERILKEGHEITNHGGTHRLFGPMKAVYGSRRHFTSLGEVVGDLDLLDRYMTEKFGYKMRLARPAHYIDKIPDGSTSYDAYRVMGYNYMAASFDGGGWQPRADGDYSKEVEEMVSPMREALERDPDFFNGKIIFQKDGCNMSLRTPVADALEPQLELLTKYGYKVITVSELMSLSPFEDVCPDSFEAPFIRTLLSKGRTVGYRNNNFYADRAITADEFAVMCCDGGAFKFKKTADFSALAAAAKAAGVPALKSASGNEMLDLAMREGVSVCEEHFKDKKNVERKYAVELIAHICEKS